jgi:hypothetical protein
METGLSVSSLVEIRVFPLRLACGGQGRSDGPRWETSNIEWMEAARRGLTRPVFCACCAFLRLKISGDENEDDDDFKTALRNCAFRNLC